jgi:hypothetical protein
VTPDYFRALNIPIVRGRNFAEQDRTGDEREAIVSRLLAARLFPGEDPIGKRFAPDKPSSVPGSIIVGVADNVKNNGLTEQSDPEMYTLRRSVPGDWSGNRLIVVIQSVMPASTIEPWVRSGVASIDRTVPVEMEPLNQTISRLADRPRFETTLLGFFALTGLVLAIVGLYGLVAFMTTRRTHEIGVRMALGATRANILRLIANDGLRMVLVGFSMRDTTSAVPSPTAKFWSTEITDVGDNTRPTASTKQSHVTGLLGLLPENAAGSTNI